MSTVAAPFGFIPVYHPTGEARAVALPGGIASAYATAIFKYQPVLLATTGVLNAVGSAADFVGVFMGCQYIPTVGARMVFTPNWVASTAYVAGSMTAFYTSDPQIVYKCQANGSLAQTSIGDQADSASFTAGSTVSGRSTIPLSTTLAGAGNQLMWRIIGLATDIDNAWGDTFTNVFVQIARHQFVSNKVAI